MLDKQNFFKHVTILTGKLQMFLIYRDKSDFSTFKI